MVVGETCCRANVGRAQPWHERVVVIGAGAFFGPALRLALLQMVQAAHLFSPVHPARFVPKVLDWRFWERVGGWELRLLRRCCEKRLHGESLRWVGCHALPPPPLPSPQCVVVLMVIFGM